jgi:hypothetical protein
MVNVHTHRSENMDGEAGERYLAAKTTMWEANSRDWVFRAEERRTSRVRPRGGGWTEFVDNSLGSWKVRDVVKMSFIKKYFII